MSNFLPFFIIIPFRITFDSAMQCLNCFTSPQYPTGLVMSQREAITFTITVNVNNFCLVAFEGEMIYVPVSYHMAII